MKIKLFTITFWISSFVTYSQINEYMKPQISQHQNTYQNTYAPIDYSLIKNSLARRQAAYDYNLNHIKYLKKWVLDLNTQSNDKDFLSFINQQYSILQNYEKQDVSLLTYEVNQVEADISNSINEVNSRNKVENSSDKFWQNGNSFLNKGDYENAITNFNKVVELNPNFADVYLNRGFAFQKRNELGLADEDYSKFIQLKPNSDIGYLHRGHLKYFQKKYIEALIDYNKLIELKPTANAYFYRALVKAGLKDYYGDIADNQKAIELNPNFSMAFNNLGWAKFNLNKFSEALTYTNRAIQLDSNNYVAFDSRSEINFMLHDYKNCVLDANVAIMLNPKLANAYFIKGRALYRLGIKIDACGNWSKAGELGKIESYDYITKYCNN